MSDVQISVPAILGYGDSVIPNTGDVAISVSGTYGTGSVSIPGPAALLCFVAGKLSRLRVDTTSISEQMNTRSTGSCELFSPPGVSPVWPREGQEIKFVDSVAGRVEFTGQINKVVTSIYPGRIVLPAYKFVISFTDLSGVLDRRVVDKTYKAGEAAAAVARDINATFLTGENITTNNVTSVAVLTQDLVLRGTAMESLRKLCDATGDLFRIDEHNDLNMFAPGAGGAAPFTLTEDGDNVRDLVLTDTDVGLTNNVFVRSDQNLGLNGSLA